MAPSPQAHEKHFAKHEAEFFFSLFFGALLATFTLINLQVQFRTLTPDSQLVLAAVD